MQKYNWMKVVASASSSRQERNDAMDAELRRAKQLYESSKRLLSPFFRVLVSDDLAILYLREGDIRQKISGSAA
jgi:hypothetical protein